MPADGTSPSFGIKTSQAGLGYGEILRVWREADQVPEFEHAWLWDHLVPLRGDVTGAALEAWTLLAAARELLAELIQADARHCVLACLGMPSVQWVADEIVNPVRALTA
jgi:hypothetical protein